MEETTSEPKPKRRWYQYDLWHLFVLAGVVAVVCGCNRHSPEDQPEQAGTRLTIAPRDGEDVEDPEEIDEKDLEEYVDEEDFADLAELAVTNPEAYLEGRSVASIKEEVSALGLLAQFADDEEDFVRLVAETRRVYHSGNSPTWKKAGQLVKIRWLHRKGRMDEESLPAWGVEQRDGEIHWKE